MCDKIILDRASSKVEVESGVLINLDYAEERTECVLVNMDAVDLSNAIQILHQALDSLIREERTEDKVLMDGMKIRQGSITAYTDAFERCLK